VVCDSCSSNKLVCVTSPAAGTEHQRQRPVRLVIDGAQLDLNHTLFTYTDDPLIGDVQPATSFITLVYSTLSNNSTNVDIALTVKSREIYG